MFGLTDTELQVPAILPKENVARGEARARITSLFPVADPFAPDRFLTGINHVANPCAGPPPIDEVRRTAQYSSPSKTAWRLRPMADVLCHGKIKDRSVRQRSG